MTIPKSVRAEILCGPTFVERFRTFAQTNDIIIEDVSMKKEKTGLLFGLLEVAAIITVIQGSIFVGKELAKLIREWLNDHSNQKVVVRTMVAFEEISPEMSEIEIQMKLRKASVREE